MRTAALETLSPSPLAITALVEVTHILPLSILSCLVHLLYIISDIQLTSDHDGLIGA